MSVMVKGQHMFGHTVYIKLFESLASENSISR